MKMVEKEVSSAKVVVGKVNVPQFDSIEEAVTTLTADAVLKLINTQHLTNEANKLRAGFNKVLSKSRARDIVIEKLMNGEYADDAGYNAAKGDKARMAAWRDAEIEKLIEESKKALPTAPDEEEEA